MKRTISSVAVPGIRTFQPTPAGMTRGAVNEGDWRLFQKGKGGAMVVYPPRHGGELAGMIVISMTELKPVAATSTLLTGPRVGSAAVKIKEDADGR